MQAKSDPPIGTIATRKAKGLPLALQRGFSLLELLTVIAIITLMYSLTAPAVNSLLQAGGERFSLTNLAAILENGRSYALSRQTYVRVAFHNGDGTIGDDAKMVVYAVYSRDGSLFDEGTPEGGMSNPAAWPLVQKPALFPMVMRAQSGTSPAASENTPAESDFGESTLNRSGQSITTRWMVQFGPDGSARVLRDTSSRSIAIPLVSIRDKDNLGAPMRMIRINASSGRVQIKE